MAVEAREQFLIDDSRPGVGKGLFARTPFKEGEFLLEYTGTKIPTPEADKSPSRYLFEIDDRWTIDGETKDNTARYINHDCYPNTEAEVKRGKIFINALRDIAPGEELTIDYGEEYFEEFIRPDGCKCASCAQGLPSPHDLKREG